jgi:para-aminobenzoate synthetase / 4-amino-4-deoxychorismate lyase
LATLVAPGKESGCLHRTGAGVPSARIAKDLGTDLLASPYAAFLRVPGGAIASFSPELFLRRTGHELLTRPIKGTGHRQAGSAEETRERNQLTGSAKNKAENVMIVDLMPSDLGRVCHARHCHRSAAGRGRAASRDLAPGLLVRGELADRTTDADLIAAAFPQGSVTGAPKVRAMDVIHDLEVTPREAYTGAVGYRSLAG